MEQQIITELKRLVGSDYVMEQLEDRICYSFDATFRDFPPDVVVKPGNVEEIAAIVKLAGKYRLPVTARGAATGLSGGAVPVQGGISLVLTRLNKILAIDTANRVAVVETGVIAEDFVNAVSQAGLFYPPDPGSIKTATIGGTIAECAGGPRGVKYGITRDYVLGLEVVLPDGRIVEVGNRFDSEMAGPDWGMLFVGSEGTLGIVTKAYLKLIDKPKAKQTLLAVFNSLDDAARTVSEMIASGTIPTTLEIMDNMTIRAVEDFLKVGLPVNAEAILLIEVDGSAKAIAKQAEHVIKVCRQCGATEMQVASTPEDMDKLWRARRAISPACGKINPTKISEDATVPRSQIPAMVRRLREIAQKYNLKMVIFGHAGDGNLHPNILSNKHDHAEMERVEQAVAELFKEALHLGGTLSGEHGIGYMKAPFLKWETGETGFAAGKKLKQVIDQQELLNPGKLFNV
ncbi:FAD-binding oxidoreductase [Sporomusa acidovorans]|uniref:FAD-linked oxidoreductase n=1 Tax=Sporomusa acidovorans (strain ATCC 49682 / DSM 3132 / Mol) TaxID=1123286 RepID=A0ABZ3IX82_SPOA4|nr:FAD-linked oxidase C-terminal domain-containing protein [Sporomusa acidovorans]OZC23602.1 putative FAD-linked oxidoreductase [Sporomusa acidovorans DSM 3132]SDE22148.1 glycolate oxidase [Sporomusa acidovorans]